MSVKPVLFVLQSGFAMGNWYWDNFVQNMCGRYEYVYLDSFNPSECEGRCTIVGIGHSLGLVKLILTDNFCFDILIGIQAFVSFCGFSDKLRSIRHSALDRMKNDYIKNGTQTISKFYERCGVCYMGGMYNDDVMRNNTLSDFEMLYGSYKIPNNILSTIIYSRQDQIVPYSVIKDNFDDAKNVRTLEVEHNMHNLGYAKSSLIIDIISGIVYDTLQVR